MPRSVKPTRKFLFAKPHHTNLCPPSDLFFSERADVFSVPKGSPHVDRFVALSMLGDLIARCGACSCAPESAA